MRNIDSIIVHCSATKAGQDFTATDIDRWHRERGFNGIGYHYVIRLDGKLEKGRDVALPGAHCKGWNEQSIGICYIGGLDENGRPADTRTNAQKRVLYQIIMDLQREYNILQVLGHRDTSPDLNGDGVIEPYEYVKACPCFDVKEFLRSGRELLFVLLVVLVVSVLLSGCRSKKEVINRESEVRVDSSLNSSSGKSLVKNKVASEKDLEVVEEHIEQVGFVFPVDTLRLKAGMVVKTVVDRKNVNEKQLLQKVDLQSVSLSDMSAKKEISKTGVEKTTNRTTGGWYWYGIILLVLVLVCWICKVKRK
ncbi:N-acetylmuramoyl-L-alanine amidase [Bacteroides congonensis]|uniref:N-acetylmuramoyl-L-alanine amidase n=1 Tax=Bacteroides congonensis TaxID=1871006 RepID=UPI001897FDE9|nr:N-acetylmuramoyl-L-alanine amidase [Bacteroides congonensis]